MKEAYDYLRNETQIGQNLTYDELCEAYGVSKYYESKFCPVSNLNVCHNNDLKFSFSNFNI